MMNIFISYRLRRFARSVTAYAFRQEEQAREDYRAACDSLYLDMLQYREEHPGVSCREVCRRFADEDTQLALKQQLRWRCCLGIAIACIVLVAVSALALGPILSSMLQNVPVSYR